MVKLKEKLFEVEQEKSILENSSFKKTNVL